MDDSQDMFFRIEIAYLVLLSAGVVTSLAGIYFAFKNLTGHAAATPEVKALRPRVSALLTTLYLTLCIVSVALIIPQPFGSPYPPALRAAIRYLGTVAAILDASVTFLILSFLIRLVDLVHGPIANASSPNAGSKSSEQLIKYVGLAAILAIINLVVSFFSLPVDTPSTSISAAYIVIIVISFLVNLIYIITSTVVLIRTKKRTSRGPLLAVAILAPLRHITDVISPLIAFGAGKLFDLPVLLKFIAAWSMIVTILKQCNVAIMVLILVKVLAHHLANSTASGEDQDDSRRPLLDTANEQPADAFNSSS